MYIFLLSKIFDRKFKTIYLGHLVYIWLFIEVISDSVLGNDPYWYSGLDSNSNWNLSLSEGIQDETVTSCTLSLIPKHIFIVTYLVNVVCGIDELNDVMVVCKIVNVYMF